MDLSTLQKKLPPWEVDTFEHALFHAMKAAGRLAGMVDDMDHLLANTPAVTVATVGEHDRRAMAFDRSDEAAKFIADLVVCGVKLAQTCPSGAVDLEAMVLQRIRDKNPPGAF